MCWLNRDCCLKWNLWLIPEAELPYNNLMQHHHARLWSFRFSYIIRISPTQTEVILYCLNNKWAKEQPGLWKSICHLKIDRSCVAWSSKFRGLEIKRVELSDSFLIHSLWAHLYSWASVLYFQETVRVISIKTPETAGAQPALPSSLCRWIRLWGWCSTLSGNLTSCRGGNGTAVFYITALPSEPCQSWGQFVSGSGQREPCFKKFMSHVLSASRWWAWRPHVIKIRLLAEGQKYYFSLRERKLRLELINNLKEVCDQVGNCRYWLTILLEPKYLFFLWQCDFLLVLLDLGNIFAIAVFNFSCIKWWTRDFLKDVVPENIL